MRLNDMPIYEYRCSGCQEIFQHLILKKDEESTLTCPYCGGGQLEKLMSRVVYHVSESDRLAQFDSNSRQSDAFYKDSRNIGLHAKKRAQQMGVNLGKDFEEKVEKLRTDPGSIIRDSE